MTTTAPPVGLPAQRDSSAPFNRKQAGGTGAREKTDRNPRVTDRRMPAGSCTATTG